MKILPIAAAALAFAGALAAAPASATTIIDFSNYEVDTTFDQPLVIGNATFYSGSGVFKIVDLGAGNALCAFNGISCGDALSVSFAVGVNNLRFDFSGDLSAPVDPDNFYDGASVSWGGQTEFLAFRGVTKGDGDPSTVQSQSFRFNNLVNLDLLPVDAGSNIGFNAFSYDDPTMPAVPEPGTWMMMLAGFGLLGYQVRRRRNPRSAVAFA